MEVRGNGLQNDQEFMEKKLGPDGWQRTLAELSLPDREVIGGKSVATSWVAFDIYIRLLEAILKASGGDDEKIIVEMGSMHANKDLGGIYGILLRAASPQFIVMRAPKLYSLYLRGGEAAVKDLRPGEMTITFKEFSKEHRLFEKLVLGYCQGAFELCHATNPEVRLIQSIADGQGCCQVLFKWKATT